MFRALSVTAILAALCGSASAAEQRHGVLVGTILKLDAASKTVVLRTEDGTEHTFHVVAGTAVHGARDTSAGRKDAFQALRLWR